MPRPSACGQAREAPRDPARLLEPGRNCWRVEPARRVAFLVDGAAYFGALRAALIGARHTIQILGWDIDSRVRLRRDDADDGWPAPLAELLDALVRARPGLRAQVLSWDYAMLFALEREWLSPLRLGWRTHRRMQFRLDGCHPVGASHHQKVVVVDGAIAFVGGLDLTRCRWDTPAHAAREPGRVDPDGKPYAPFHDVQMAVDGAAAAALGQLCAERWLRASGRPGLCAPDAPAAGAGGFARGTSPGAPPSADLWPAGLVPDLTDVPVGIARTEPGFEGWAPVAEVKTLLADAIVATRAALYIENQYFSSSAMADALAARLAAPEPPDMALVLPRRQSGWLEETTMGVLRGRIDARLRAADPAGRYRAWCPRLADEPPDGGGCLNVHSKVMVVDDDFVTVGSANLSNRSMGFDSECNLAIASGGDARVRDGIRAFRARLLGEHLDVAPERVDAALREHGRLNAAIDALRDETARACVPPIAPPEARHAEAAHAAERLDRGQGPQPDAAPDADDGAAAVPGHGSHRTLVPAELRVAPEIDRLVPDAALIIDPERPAETELLMTELLPRAGQRRPVRGRVLAWTLIAVGLAALAMAWRYTPLRELLDIGELVRFGERLDALPFSPLAVVACYVLAGLVVMPLMLLVGVTGIVFGPIQGGLYALAGALASAAATWGVGRLLGRRALLRWGGPRMQRLAMRLARRGLPAMVLLRVVPVAPFSIVNLVAGAAHVGLRDFMAGTALGMTPGILFTTVFVDRIAAAIREPGWASFALLAGVVLVCVVFAMFVRRWVGRRRDAKAAA
ncbi:VTT domain-containing protein [Derxia gummosa]|uniref:VTT domain-containing protein n=1 Tax=Derxia gummosa DSM 723 TaxID=1121388 RepID=A0A8B6X170_9BURK|nr:VTT domain-containing protein [Derxia gummosa]